MAEAALTNALIDRDNGPLTALYGLPDSREGARLADIGDDAWEFYVTASNHSTRDADGGESVLFDGETRRIGIRYRRAVSDHLELGIEAPWVSHESGGLDGIIDRWHSVFGLSDGIRNERARDELLFRYQDNGAHLDLSRNVQGLGDVRLIGGWRLAETARSHFALRFSYKFPTGDSGSLLGSGGSDVSLGIAGDRTQVMGVERLSGFYRLNATWLGKPDFEALSARRVVGQVSGGLGLDLTARTTLALQLLVRSPVYASAVSPLGDVSASLTGGVRFRLSRTYWLTFAVSEDIQRGSMPDVTFALSLQRR